MNTAETIVHHLEQFPEAVQAEVLDFVLFLKQKKTAHQTDPPTAEKRAKLLEIMVSLQQSKVFVDIENPENWQRSIRTDRSLPGREC